MNENCLGCGSYYPPIRNTCANVLCRRVTSLELEIRNLQNQISELLKKQESK